jgi:hypothetical protein
LRGTCCCAAAGTASAAVRIIAAIGTLIMDLVIVFYFLFSIASRHSR